MDRTAPRRNRLVHNYAAVNHKGFQSLRPIRIKSRVKRRVGAPSPGSGDWHIELLKDTDMLNFNHDNAGHVTVDDPLSELNNGGFQPGMCTPHLHTIVNTASESELTNIISP